MKKLANVHPGEILVKEYLQPLGITPYALAKAIGVDQTRISQLIKGKRSISADTSIRFSKYFNVSSEFWLNEQSRYDLAEEMKNMKKYQNIKPLVTDKYQLKTRKTNNTLIPRLKPQVPGISCLLS